MSILIGNSSVNEIRFKANGQVLRTAPHLAGITSSGAQCNAIWNDFASLSYTSTNSVNCGASMSGFSLLPSGSSSCIVKGAVYLKSNVSGLNGSKGTVELLLKNSAYSQLARFVLTEDTTNFLTSAKSSLQIYNSNGDKIYDNTISASTADRSQVSFFITSEFKIRWDWWDLNGIIENSVLSKYRTDSQSDPSGTSYMYGYPQIQYKTTNSNDGANVSGTIYTTSLTEV